jgi:hypothetical protein
MKPAPRQRRLIAASSPFGPQFQPEGIGHLCRRCQLQIAVAGHEPVQLGRGDARGPRQLVVGAATTTNRLAERFYDPPQLLPARSHGRPPPECDPRSAAGPPAPAGERHRQGRPAPPGPHPAGGEGRRLPHNRRDRCVSTPGLSPLRQDAGGGQLGRDLAVAQTGLSADGDPLLNGLPRWGRDHSAVLAGPAKRPAAGPLAVRPLADTRRSPTSRQFPLEGANRLRPAGGLQSRQEALRAGEPCPGHPRWNLALYASWRRLIDGLSGARNLPDSACPT